MMRQVSRLTDFIKPSTPNDTGRTKIHQNTTNWMQTNMTILQDHYTATITALSDTPRNPLALQIAIGWARKRYTSQLTLTTIHTIHHILGIQTQQTQTNISTNTTPHPTQTNPPTNRTLSPIPEEDEDFPRLPRPQAPHKLSLYLGRQTTLSEHLTHHTTQRQHQQTQQTHMTTETETIHPSANRQYTHETDYPLRKRSQSQPRLPPTQLETDRSTQTPIQPNTSTPLPQQLQRADIGPQQQDTQKTDTEDKDPQLSPILPITSNNTDTPGTSTQLTFLEDSTTQENNKSHHPQPTTRRGNREVAAQVHSLHKPLKPYNKNLETPISNFPPSKTTQMYLLQ